jgi:CHAT domain-containing protein
MSNYNNLPGTLKEVNDIKAILSKQTNIIIKSFQGEFATEENLKNNLNTDILHIATHSFFINRELQINKYDLTPFNGVFTNSYYGNQYFDNGLVFSGVNNLRLECYNGSHDNGFLYAGEIENLNMSQVKLVVLSSCETGLANESLFQTTRGLINSLEKAGVQNAIVSLWKVDDKVTQEFMVQFYKNLFYETSISNALRKTKLDIKKLHPEPYYWAPFVLYQLN